MASRTLLQLCLLTLASLTTAQPPWFSGNGNQPSSNSWFGPGSSSSPSSPSNDNDNNNNNNNNGGFNPSDFAESTIGMAPATASHMIQIHGILACIAFVALFPIGSISIRVIPSRHAWIVHAATQVTAYALYIAAAAIGLWLVSTIHFPSFTTGDDIPLFTISAINYHFIIGVVVLIVLFFQPLTGFVHHIKYKHSAAAAATTTPASPPYDKDYSVSPPRNRHQPHGNGNSNTPAPYIKRTVWSHLHLWLGRIAITMGMINGGLGLGIAGVGQNAIIAYSVIAGLMWFIWVAAMVYGEVKRSKARKAERKRPRDMRVMPGAYTGGGGYSTYRAPPPGANGTRGGGRRGGGGGGGDGMDTRGGGAYYTPVYENPDAVGNRNNAETTTAGMQQQEHRSRHLQQQQQRGEHDGDNGDGTRRKSTASSVDSDRLGTRDERQVEDQAPYYRTPPAPPVDEGHDTGNHEPASPGLPIQAPQPRRDGGGGQTAREQPVNRTDTVSPLSIYGVRY